ncbi:MAG: RusA family crossover junction endodeoxyribonuclease [Colwellia sp.]|nr:RusA family crossover junction endodeoxyribonuclease [Colwellia sp.]
MCDYEFELPWPPSVNGGYRGVFRGRILLSKKGREYKEKAHAQIKNIGLENEKVSERLSVSIDLFPPDKRRRDVDNYTKAAFDAITESGFWIDDEQVDVLTIKKCEKVKGGKLVVKVTKL